MTKWRTSYFDIYSNKQPSVHRNMVLWLLEHTEDKQQFNYYFKKLNLLEHSALERGRFIRIAKKGRGPNEFRTKFKEEYLRVRGEQAK